ncbi:hypothetical protein CWB41_06980 [Methylovirgula ligni]|uniref:Sugar phosphate permease n=1 Tax=Methylovirgula ligni TaxID=569860 RepID=A0A3D9Z2V0_9HYPH|nr:MFS transporter [Methylovirgula ligni]QAY95508.1 hypothetical protein CWB41_06980 [Methylovirgula ligni]REF89155.1 sugar phosphate permease [Methylovirgula ligni]
MNETATPIIKRGTAWLLVGILLIFYVVSFVDRTVITIMIGPIEKDLHITDFQMSLLIGPAFGILYVLAGLFTGTLVDRFPRRLITAAGVALWGAATSFCGLSGSFASLLLSRIGVGIGESTLTPAAHSMIGESFPRKMLATAVSVFTTGSVLGAGIALVAGGAIINLVKSYSHISLPLIGDIRPWQLVFLIVGLVTLVVTPLIFIVPEPPRATGKAGVSTGDTRVGFVPLLKRHWDLYLALPVGFGCTNILVQSYNAWMPTFLMRTYGLNAAQAGMALGLLTVFAGVVGQIVSAVLTDKLYARGMGDAHVRFHLLAVTVSLPLMLIALTRANVWEFIAASSVFYCFTWTFVGCSGAALQLYTPSYLRGRVSALYLAIITLIGTLIGPPATAWMTDHWFGRARIGSSLIVMTIATLPLIWLVLLRVCKAMRVLHANPVIEIVAPDLTFTSRTGSAHNVSS